MANIQGVVIKSLKVNKYDKGWLSEIYRSDEDSTKVAMSYVSFANFGKAMGPHEHNKQTDFFIFVGPGDFEVFLWDNRRKSNTFGLSMKKIAGESNRVSMLVPPGVVHGYKSISKEGSMVINLPDKLYAGKGRKEKVDEIRYEHNESSKFRI
jgi:dTDP-4-dehydrorhamnose 3,5-epimerase